MEKGLQDSHSLLVGGFFVSLSFSLFLSPSLFDKCVYLLAIKKEKEDVRMHLALSPVCSL